MIKVLQLIRWKNLLLISISQSLIIESLFDKEQISVPSILYIICTFCFAAGGNIINDIFDVVTDKVNKPNKMIVDKFISTKKAYLIYYVFNIVGLIITIYGSYLLNNFSFISYGILVIALLYIYSAYLKGTILIGNITIAFLTSLSLLFLILIIPCTQTQTNILLIISVFAFLINLAREIIKDIEDIKGDKKANLNTLPIVLGTTLAIKIVKIITIISLFILLIFLFLCESTYLKIYILITIILPLSYVLINLKKDRKKLDFSKISKALKLIIAFGTFIILFI